MEDILVTIANLHRNYPKWIGFHYSRICDQYNNKDEKEVKMLIQQAIEAGFIKIEGPKTDYALTEAGWHEVEKIEKEV